MTSPLFPNPQNTLYTKTIRRAFLSCCGFFFLLFLATGIFYLQQKNALSQQNFKDSQERFQYAESTLPVKIKRLLKQTSPSDPAFLHQFRELVYEVDLNESGYAIVFDQTGKIIHHPNIEIALTAMSMAEKESPLLTGQVSQLLTTRNPSFRSYTDKGTPMWTFMAPLDETPYFLAAVFFKRDLNTLPYRKKVYIILFLSFTLSLLFGSGLLLKIEYLNPSLLKKASAFFTLVMLSNTLLICLLQMRFTGDESTQKNTISSQTSLHKFKAVSAARIGATERDIVYIPTGVFIKSVHIKSADSVSITGYVWQKFLKSAQAKIPEAEREIVFNNQLDIEWGATSIQDFGSYELRGKNFKASIQQDFTYTHYPLNHEEITLRIVTPNIGKNVVLIPELDAYSPNFAVGIDPQLKIEGWEWEQTYFTYHFYKLPTNFGVGTLSVFPEVPELRFNILVRRNIGGAFSLNIVIILLVLILLFGIFVKTTPDHAANYKPLDVYGPCSLLLFNLLVAHSRLRQDVTLAIDKAVYIDQLYFVSYTAITLVVFHFLFFSEKPHLIMRYQNSIVPKSLYWPILMTIIYGVTLSVFW